MLTITEVLRKHGVVGKFVEFFGDGLGALTIADRATLGNMCPEYGATVAIFPIDEMTLDYLRLTGRDDSRVAAGRGVREGAGPLPHAGQRRRPSTRKSIELDLSTDRAEPGRAEAPAGSRVAEEGEGGLPDGAADDAGAVQAAKGASAGGGARRGGHGTAPIAQSGVAVADPALDELDHGAVVIAAITSCTNTSNPSVMIGAGLLAKKAVEKGLQRKPWVKSSLAPGSKVVTEYLDAAGLTPYLDQLGFNLVGLRLHDLHRQQRSAARRDCRRSFAKRTSSSARC